MWGIVTVSEGGMKIAEIIKGIHRDSLIYSTSDFPDSELVRGSLKDFTGQLFNKHEILIFITACGIAVRCISPYLKDKTSDPGVIVIDEKGAYIISLLSGHIGGANKTAAFIAEKIGGKAVITTASDVNNIISPDMIAVKYGFIIDNMEYAKKITAMMVKGKKTALYCDPCVEERNSCVKSMEENYFCMNPESEQFTDDIENADGIVAVTNRIIRFDKPQVTLIPVNIVIGVGCKKGKSKEEIIYAIEYLLKKHNIDKRAVKAIASIELKKNEHGIIEASEKFGVPFITVPACSINSRADEFLNSEFVFKTAGCGSVSEGAACIASGKDGTFIERKKIFNETSCLNTVELQNLDMNLSGITISLWEEKI